MDRKSWSLRGKIILLGIFLPTILVVFLLNYFVGQSVDQTREAFISKARAICLNSESIRDEMESKWDKGIFSLDQVRGYVNAGQMDKVLAVVPVVSAWSAAMRKAEQGGYEFKVPKFQPRNPKNEPDALERRALEALKDGSLSEYHEVDPSINAVRYFLPVRLSKTCLICHGDPAQSQELWGNDKGLDPTGTAMENWKEGEVHGAFEVIQYLDAADKQLEASITSAGWISGIGLVVMGVLFALLSIRLVANSVIKPIRMIIRDISDGSRSLNSAASMVSRSSQTLAEGSVSQAASLEQSSAALEEVTSMTRANAESVNDTSRVAHEVRNSLETAETSMQGLYKAIELIKESADQTAVIIKSIQEISFQTNLLSLNAAVEAARAGEAGAGFAVVAEEVRSLAGRAAEAATNTTSLIESSQQNADRGFSAVTEVRKILDEIVGGVGEVSRLADQIATASSEQAEGVNQVNIGVNEVDRVTQDNAAIAEEVASSSESLNSEAVKMDRLVEQLTAIVGKGAEPAAKDGGDKPKKILGLLPRKQ